MNLSKLLCLSLIFSFIACQTARKYTGRVISTTSTLRTFLGKIAKQAGHESTEQIEKNILTYIKSKNAAGEGNWRALGLTDDQVKNLKTAKDLDANHAYMPKLHNAIMDNITVMSKMAKGIERRLLADFFEEVVANGSGRLNPYKISGSTSSIRARQRSSAPKSIEEIRQKRVLKSLDSVTDRSARQAYTKTLSQSKSRGKSSAVAHANGQDIVESAVLITRKTGHKAMGEGCEGFMKHASPELIATKADIDRRTAEIIQDAAHQKAGRTFASIDEIPLANRLSLDDVDTARQRAFKEVLGYTDDEAELALRRLKEKPCKQY